MIREKPRSRSRARGPRWLALLFPIALALPGLAQESAPPGAPAPHALALVARGDHASITSDGFFAFEGEDARLVASELPKDLSRFEAVSLELALAPGAAEALVLELRFSDADGERTLLLTVGVQRGPRASVVALRLLPSHGVLSRRALPRRDEARGQTTRGQGELPRPRAGARPGPPGHAVRRAARGAVGAARAGRSHEGKPGRTRAPSARWWTRASLSFSFAAERRLPCACPSGRSPGPAASDGSHARSPVAAVSSRRPLLPR